MCANPPPPRSYGGLARGVFEVDRVLLASLLGVRVMLRAETIAPIDVGVLGALIATPAAVPAAADVRKKPAWLAAEAWVNAAALAEAGPPGFRCAFARGHMHTRYPRAHGYVHIRVRADMAMCMPEYAARGDMNTRIPAARMEIFISEYTRAWRCAYPNAPRCRTLPDALVRGEGAWRAWVEAATPEAMNVPDFEVRVCV